MGKRAYFVRMFFLGIMGIFLLGGCTGKNDTQREKELSRNGEGQGPVNIEQTGGPEIIPESLTEGTTKEPEEKEAEEEETEKKEPEIKEADWSGYFNGINGAAVLYDAVSMEYQVFNRELAETRRSPCSTFKIISSLIALENGIMDPEDSIRSWSGEIFWNEDWNRDLDFDKAFKASCVWYFREVTDEVGPEMMQEGIDQLLYGNRDISDWEGRENTNNNNRALTGFWIESSLLISPKEQTEVMGRIFGKDSVYSEKTQDELKKVMLVEESGSDISIYGKTGMGKTEGVVVDAWYTGFAQKEGETIYFCVYLGRTDDKKVSSAGAKEIAIRLVEDYFNGLSR